jgi:anaerobic selenocysteine-containing dehydrogenase
MRTQQTYCRVCASHCGVALDIDDNRITAVRGDAANPLTRGYFCIKGKNAADWHNGQDRLLNCLRRTSDGEFAPVDPEIALNEIHERLAAIVAESGPQALAVYHGTGIFQNVIGFQAMHDWAHLIGTPYIYSSMTVDQSAKWVRMGRMGHFATGKHNSLDADVLILVGNNPAVSHFGFGLVLNNPAAWLKDGRKRGMKLIVIDPRRTETAQMADAHLPVVPGTDGVLFAGMIRLAIERGWHDAVFCTRFTSALDVLRQAVEPFTLELVARRTGLDAAQIEQTTELFACAARKSVITGTGANMGPNSNVTEHLIEAFNAICGGYRRAGDTLFNTSPLFGLAAQREAVLPPKRTWEHGVKCHSADIGPLMNEYPTGLLPDEIAGGPRGRIRAMMIVGGNPAMAGGVALAGALRKLDLLVVIDSRTTATTAQADYVLATELMYERPDCTAAYDVPSAHTYVRVTARVLDPPPNVISDLNVFWGLARRMGKALTIRQPRFGRPYPGDEPGFRCDPDLAPDPAEIVRWMVSQGSLSYQEIAAHEHGLLIDRYLPTIQPAEDDGAARLDLCAEDVAAEIAGLLPDGSADREWPYLLIVRRMLGTLNSAFSNLPATRQTHPVNPANMHPDDLAAEGLCDGVIVRVRSQDGSVLARVKSDRSLLRGTVSMTHCWGTVEEADDPRGERGAFTGRLIPRGVREPINYMPVQTAIPVSIERTLPRSEDGHIAG